ncbi:hypothetical protein FPHYL_6117 [Fusarium phyllophilum]|uniref:Uncharacterized protein n=1 Tax=Fusarium phyllophilum TaxID=47803 RepID=A0A8H5NDX9_9HYPO|nr:hypothetical protein FPHYL_6117 [Fusarium phyllophilum]
MNTARQPYGTAHASARFQSRAQSSTNASRQSQARRVVQIPYPTRIPPAPPAVGVQINNSTWPLPLPLHHPPTPKPKHHPPSSCKPGVLAEFTNLNQLVREYQSGQATQVSILLELEKMNGFCEGISRLRAVKNNQLEILAAVRALKPSADDQRANLAALGIIRYRSLEEIYKRSEFRAHCTKLSQSFEQLD